MEFTQTQLLYSAVGLAGGLLLGIFAGLGYRLRQLSQQRRRLGAQLAQLSREHGELRQAHGQLQARLREREAQHRAQVGLLNEHRSQLRQEFEHLAHRIFENRSEQFASHSRQSLESLLQPFRDQISQFQQRVDQVHTESIKGQANLEGELRKVLEIGLQMNTQASNLTAALKGDNKAAGNWGEAQLERSLQLAGLQAGEHYEAQAALRDGEGRRRLPDFLVKLPDDKHLVIDSKVSLVDYERAVAAADEPSREAALAAHIRAVRRHIDDLARKDYAHLPQLDSPDFVLMFMPVEPAYIEALRHNRELFNYGYQQGVILVSHTTLMPILRTVANLWMVDRSNREARAIGDRAGEIYNQVCLLAQRLQKLGNTLGTASSHYNDAVRALVGSRGLHAKVERFQQLSTRANRSMPELAPIHPDLEQDRLAAVEPAPPQPLNGEAHPDATPTPP
jgi:DNA recombination protein RmuC